MEYSPLDNKNAGGNPPAHLIALSYETTNLFIPRAEVLNQLYHE